MRLLADENFRSRLSGRFAPRATMCYGPEPIFRMEGRLLLEFAESQGRLLLTLDKDFCQIALQRRVPLEKSGVILFRIHPATPENFDPLVQAL